MTTAIACFVSMLIAASAAPAQAADETAADPPGPSGSIVARIANGDDRDPPEARMWREVGALLDELHRLRAELAQARLELEDVRRERDELRQFIEDHDAYGQDFEQYRSVREVAERDQRRRELDAARERAEAERAERLARAEQMRVVRDQQREEARRNRQYRDAGFIGLGLDVYISRVSYHYPTRDFSARLRFDPFLGRGHFLRYHRVDEVDFSQLTMSGALVNAAAETRNVGVAIVFFDERGVQVGQETIHINNARPDVPYPFTATVTMTLDRPFTSSTSYVLFADPIDPEDLERN